MGILFAPLRAAGTDETPPLMARRAQLQICGNVKNQLMYLYRWNIAWQSDVELVESKLPWLWLCLIPSPRIQGSSVNGTT